MPPQVTALQPDRVSEVAAFVGEADRASSGFTDFDEDVLRWLLRLDRVDVTKDTFVITEDEGITGFAMLWEPEEGRVLNAFIAIHPAPCYPRNGPALLEALWQRGSERGTAGMVFRMYMDMRDDNGRALLERNGWRHVRSNRSMFIDLRERAAVAVPDGIEIRRGRSLDDARLVYQLDQETFADHWGFVPMTFEEYERRNLTGREVDPGKWLFAFEGEEPVGMIVLDERAGNGWVQELGVRAPWRGRGIAKALLGRGFEELAARKFTAAGLGVDSDNHTGAFALYEKVGMTVARGDDVFEKLLGDP